MKASRFVWLSKSWSFSKKWKRTRIIFLENLLLLHSRLLQLSVQLVYFYFVVDSRLQIAWHKTYWIFQALGGDHKRLLSRCTRSISQWTFWSPSELRARQPSSLSLECKSPKLFTSPTTSTRWKYHWISVYTLLKSKIPVTRSRTKDYLTHGMLLRIDYESIQIYQLTDSIMKHPHTLQSFMMLCKLQIRLVWKSQSHLTSAIPPSTSI